MKQLGLLILVLAAVAVPGALRAATPPLDGVYDTSFTRAQYAAAGADLGELNYGSGNWGHFGSSCGTAGSPSTSPPARRGAR
jgi:hypothetical protein